MEKKKLEVSQEMLDLINLKLIDIETANKIKEESRNVKIEYPIDEPFNVSGITLEQAREAAKKLNINL